MGAAAGVEATSSDKAPGTRTDTAGVVVGIGEMLNVTKFCGSIEGVTVVEARGPGNVSVGSVSDSKAVSCVLCTVVTTAVERRTVTVSAASLDGVTEDAIDATTGVSGAAGAGSLNGTVVITVVDIRRVAVPPAGIDGLVTVGTGMVVADCSEGLGTPIGSIVVSGTRVVVADCSAEPAVGGGVSVVAGFRLVAG